MKKLLIANRGEIAVRIIRTARAMGIATVSVYSEADANATHVALADEAHLIGPPEPSASYLDIDRILETAKKARADAIHPGYGFLSERPEFAEACANSNISFIGPGGKAMRALGSKIDAKKIAVGSGVPITPGFFQEGATPDRLKKAALEIGYPVMLKASAGGGGRGMRVVTEPADFPAELRLASEEAQNAFGDGAMMIEKLVEQPRHIEVQILADKHGNVACLFERECSLQRRHQKIMEEAPSPDGEKIWDRLQAYAKKLAAAAGYTNAGTVEFIYDEPSDSLYFMEVNARLQVEHPVTEAITGLDLVEWQIRVARGEKLSLSAGLMEGSRSSIRGHSVEARVVAEDPARGFLPSNGRIVAWAPPVESDVRVDSGYEKGSEVSRFYDSLLAKVISHADRRDLAIGKLETALLDFHVLGVRTNIAYIIDVMRHRSFQEGKIDTEFLDREFSHWTGESSIPAELANILAATALRSGSEEGQEPEPNAWSLADGFRN